MKRPARKLALFLLLLLAGGTILNIAVAWGCGWLSAPEDCVYGQPQQVFVYAKLLDEVGTARHEISFEDRGPLKGSIRAITMIKGFGIRSLQLPFPNWSHAQKPANDWRSNLWLEGLAWDAPLRKVDVQTFSAQGWPFLAMSYIRVHPDRTVNGLLLSSHVRPSNIYFDHALGFRPIWSGFAINTVFYAAVLWLLFAAPFALRRRSRRRRGLCPACAYPIGTSDICTECGQRL